MHLEVSLLPQTLEIYGCLFSTHVPLLQNWTPSLKEEMDISQRGGKELSIILTACAVVPSPSLPSPNPKPSYQIALDIKQ